MHWTITGTTGSGKGELMKRKIIPESLAKWRPVLILDPIIPANVGRDAWGKCVKNRQILENLHVFNDPDEFLHVAKASRKCLLVIDEYGHWRDTGQDKKLNWTYTMSRNWGMLAYAMAQRIMQIPPSVRNQCTNHVILNQPEPDLADLLRSTGVPEIMEAKTFPPGIAMVVKPFEKPVKIRIF